MEKFDPLKEIELTLASLDNVPKSKAPEGFLDELSHRVIFREEQVVWARRAKLAIAAMFALAILNSVLLFQDHSPAREQLLDSLATEWDLSIEEY